MINVMVEGNLNTGYALFGMGISFIYEIKTAARIVDQLYLGYLKNVNRYN